MSREKEKNRVREYTIEKRQLSNLGKIRMVIFKDYFRQISSLEDDLQAFLNYMKLLYKIE